MIESGWAKKVGNVIHWGKQHEQGQRGELGSNKVSPMEACWEFVGGKINGSWSQIPGQRSLGIFLWLVESHWSFLNREMT